MTQLEDQQIKVIFSAMRYEMKGMVNGDVSLEITFIEERLVSWSLKRQHAIHVEGVTNVASKVADHHGDGDGRKE